MEKKSPEIPSNPREWMLFRCPHDRLRMTIGESHSYPTVVPAWAAPLSHPDQFLSLLDAKGEEIRMVTELTELNDPAQAAVTEELRRRYLTSRVQRIEHAKVEFGSTYWTVQTERGRKEFVTQSLQENAQWLSPNQLLLIDIDGNRFEIPDVNQLDPKSLRFIETIL